MWTCEVQTQDLSIGLSEAFVWISMDMRDDYSGQNEQLVGEGSA